MRICQHLDSIWFDSVSINEPRWVIEQGGRVDASSCLQALLAERRPRFPRGALALPLLSFLKPTVPEEGLARPRTPGPATCGRPVSGARRRGPDLQTMAVFS